MKRILILVTLLSIVLSGCYKSDWSKSQKICDDCDGKCISVEISSGTFYKCEIQEENIIEEEIPECIINTLKGLTGIEKQQVAFMVSILERGDEIDWSIGFSDKSTDAFVYYLEECKGLKSSKIPDNSIPLNSYIIDITYENESEPIGLGGVIVDHINY